MKAIVQDSYGSFEALRLREVPEPAVGENQALVRVRAASLHPDVWHVVMGRPWVLRLMGAGFSRPKNPIPGTDMAGVVESVGEGVTRFRPGDEVFGETTAAESWQNGGAFAELVSAPQECLALKPANVTFEQAASVPTSGCITLSNLPLPGQLKPGCEALVNGAGGGVGSLAVQILKAWGATVTGVDAAGKLDMLRVLGADRVIDYAREDFTRGQRRYDFIFDVPADRPFSVCKRALTSEGRYVPIGHDHFGRAGRRVFGLLPYFIYLLYRSRHDKNLGSGRPSRPDKQSCMSVLRELLEAGKITPLIDSVHPLADFHRAFRRLVDGELQGKVVLQA